MPPQLKLTSETLFTPLKTNTTEGEKAKKGSRERESKKCPLCMRATTGECLHAKALIEKTGLKAPFIGIHNNSLLDKCPTSSPKFTELKDLIEKTIVDFTNSVPENDFTIDKKPYRQMLNKHFYQKIHDLGVAKGIFPRELNQISYEEDYEEIVNNRNEILIGETNGNYDKPAVKRTILPPPQTSRQQLNNSTSSKIQQVSTKSSSNSSCIKKIDSPTITTPKTPFPVKSEKALVQQSTTPSISPPVRGITTPARRSTQPIKKSSPFTSIAPSPQKIVKQKIMVKNKKTKKRELMMLSQTDFNSLDSLGDALGKNINSNEPIGKIKFKYPENGKYVHLSNSGLQVIQEMIGKYELLEFSIGKKLKSLTTPYKV